MFVLFLAMWLVLTGTGTPASLLGGAAVAALLTLFCQKYIAPRGSRRMSPRRFAGVLGYALYLLGSILRACLAVIAAVWSGREVKPKLARFRPAFREEGSSVVLANSITLTPGTITADIEHGEFFVHALDAPFAEGLAEGGFVRRLRKLEEEP